MPEQQLCQAEHNNYNLGSSGAMARKRRKKALYEVMSKARSRTSKEKEKQKDTEKPDKKETAASDNVQRGLQAQWPRKPRILQFNAGRVEISMPYQLAVAVLLGILLLVLVFYRLGQMSYLKNQNKETPETSGKFEPRPLDSGEESPGIQTPQTGESEKRANEDASTGESGDNVIVIQILKDKTQLEPVKKYFNSLGIATMIIEKNNRYYLVTRKKYDNPDKSGTPGFRAKQKIIRLGAGYKPPSGYKSFGEKPFSDAFGMKLND